MGGPPAERFSVLLWGHSTWLLPGAPSPSAVATASQLPLQADRSCAAHAGGGGVPAPAKSSCGVPAAEVAVEGWHGPLRAATGSPGEREAEQRHPCAELRGEGRAACPHPSVQILHLKLRSCSPWIRTFAPPPHPPPASCLLRWEDSCRRRVRRQGGASVLLFWG